jgi:hypothetical protein
MHLTWTVFAIIALLAIIASAVLRPDLLMFIAGIMRGRYQQGRPRPAERKPPGRVVSEAEFQERLKGK